MEEPPNILDGFMEYVEQVQAVPFEYLTAGLGLALLMMPVQILAVFVVYIAAGLGALPGVVAEDETLMILGMTAAPLGTLVLLAIAMMLVTTPMQASLIRAVHARQERGEEGVLGPAACFSTFKEDVGRVLSYVFLHMAIYTMLLPFCMLPGIVFLVATDFGWPLVVLDGKRPLEAIQRSAKHFFAHLPWHLGYTLILVSGAFVLQYLPLLGAFVTPGLVAGWRLWAYRQIRADLLA